MGSGVYWNVQEEGQPHKTFKTALFNHKPFVSSVCVCLYALPGLAFATYVTTTRA